MRKLLPFFFLLFYVPAHATITFRQDASNQASSNTTVAATLGMNSVAGCGLVVTAADYVLTAFATPSLATPTDTQGNVFLPLPLYRGKNPLFSFVQSWYVHSCIGGADVVTITGNAGDLNIVITEYTPTAPGTFTLDQKTIWACGQTAQDSTMGVIATPPVYTSTATELVYAWAFNSRTITTFTANNSFTIREQSGMMNFQGTIVTADRNVTSRGTYSTTFTGTISNFAYSGAVSFSEGASVITPAIQQVACGDSIQPWHEMGTFTSEDVLLQEVKSGDYIFVGYRINPAGAVTPGITNTNGYTWNTIYSVANFVLWYAVAPMDAVAGDVLTFSNISNNNASKVVVLHGLSALPSLTTSGATAASMSLTLSGYTTPLYYANNDHATTAQLNGIMLDTRALLGDFLIFAQAETSWAYMPPAIPSTTPSPGTAGTDLFPTDRDFLAVWLPGAPATSVLHAAQEY